MIPRYGNESAPLFANVDISHLLLTSGNGAVRPPFQRVYRARRRVVDQVTLPALFLVCRPVGHLVLLRVLTLALLLVQLPVFLAALVRDLARAQRLTTGAIAAVATQNINAC
jgi:hypothetical protein